MAVAFVAVAAGFLIRKRQEDAFERVVKWLKGSRQVLDARRTGDRSADFDLEEGPGQVWLETYASARGDGLRLTITMPLSRHLPSMLLTPKGLVGNSDDVLTGDKDFDKSWLLRSGRPDAARLAFGPSARAALRDQKLSRIEVEGRKLTLVQDDGVPSVPLMIAAFRLARALPGGTWSKHAAQLGLAVDGEHLVGVIDGLETRVQLWGGNTRVWVKVNGHGLTACHKDHARFRGLPINNPVLSGLIAVKGDPALLEELLADEELVGPLLEVVHGHPGSQVDPTGVVLEVPGVAREELLDLVPKAVELARRLRA